MQRMVGAPSGAKGGALRQMSQMLIIAAIVPCAFVACSKPDSTDATEDAVRVRTEAEMLERRRELLQRRSLDRAPPPVEAITGEVPEQVLETAMLALEKLTGALRSDFETVKAEEIIWPDGALGCPQRGMTYTQAPVPGYHIVLQHNGRQYDYRAGGTRFLMLCLEPNEQIPSGIAAPVL